MKPVDQTRFVVGEGNCFSACVASLLGLGIDDVPFFMGEDNWDEALLEWCAARGVGVDFSTQFPAPRGTLCIVGGESPRYKANGHSVIARDGVVIHDPHPDRSGIVGEPWIWIALRRQEV